MLSSFPQHGSGFSLEHTHVPYKASAIRPPAPNLPPIIVRDRDLPGLLAAAFDGLATAPREAGALLQEVERAAVVTERREWKDVAVPGSQVLYREGLIGPPRWTKLVMPEAADETGKTLSVLSYTGSGLLGLAIGQAISWADHLGGAIRLEIINISHTEDEALS